LDRRSNFFPVEYRPEFVAESAAVRTAPFMMLAAPETSGLPLGG
jgi:hypothetical protein